MSKEKSILEWKVPLKNEKEKEGLNILLINEEEEETKNEKIEKLNLIIRGDRDTLGNMLRYELQNDPQVLYAAYRCEHPTAMEFTLFIKLKEKEQHNKKAFIEAVIRALDRLLTKLKQWKIDLDL